MLHKVHLIILDDFHRRYFQYAEHVLIHDERFEKQTLGVGFAETGVYFDILFGKFCEEDFFFFEVTRTHQAVARIYLVFHKFGFLVCHCGSLYEVYVVLVVVVEYKDAAHRRMDVVGEFLQHLVVHGFGRATRTHTDDVAEYRKTFRSPLTAFVFLLTFFLLRTGMAQ